MKYIIDIPNELAEATARYWNETTDMTLVPYTEPDRKAIEDEVWKFVRTVTDMIDSQRIQCFGSATCDLDDYLTYQEAKSKYEARKKWKKQRDEIHVGDEVTNLTDYKGVVVKIYDDKTVNIMWDNGNVGNCKTNTFHKTGRHFDEVAELLEKMRGGEE